MREREWKRETESERERGKWREWKEVNYELRSFEVFMFIMM